MPKIRTLIFDLDGTLLHTLPDLVEVTNTALEHFGYPTHTTEEILSYVGNGLRALMVQAVPAGTNEQDTQKALDYWKITHEKIAGKNTHPFPGIPETCAELRKAGCKLAVLSNKYDGGTKQIMDSKMPGAFDAVHGEGPGFPRKPNTTGLLKTMEELGAEASTTAYVGDSPSYIETALAAGVLAVGLNWGYHAPEELVEAGAQFMLDSAEDLLKLL